MQISKSLAAALVSVAALQGVAANPYAGSVMIMNEETTGNPGNGSINIFNPQGEGSWIYRAFRQANPRREIPGAICHAATYGDKLYVVSNHPDAPGSYNMVGTLTVMNAETLVYVNSVELVNRFGKPVQGRAVMPYGDDAYVTTTDGILTYRSYDNTIIQDNDRICSPDGVASPVPYQYPYQTGAIARVGYDYYIASQDFGLVYFSENLPIYARNRSIPELLGDNCPEGLSDANGIGSIVTGNDGNLWMSVTADRNATGEAAPYLIKYNPVNQEAEAIAVPEGIYPPANSWYAWTADGFHASATENALYWNGGPNTWFSNSAVFKYDIDKGEFSKLLDLSAEELPAGENPWMIYGCSMRTSPVTGEMYLSLFKDYGLTNFVLRRLAADGTKIADYPMEPAIWYPALPVFADDAAPSFKEVEELVIPSDEATHVDLLGFATDPDSPDAEINYYVKDVSYPAEKRIYAEVEGRALGIYPPGVEIPEKPGAPAVSAPAGDGTEEGYIDLVADSKGKTATCRVKFRFATSSVDEVSDGLTLAAASVRGDELTLRADKAATAFIFTPQGCQVMTIDAPEGESVHSLDALVPGLYILHFGGKSLKFRL